MNLPEPRAAAATIRSRLALIRAEMLEAGLAAYIVPSADPHLSEYLPSRWCTRQWLSGFTGSVGTLVVTSQWAGLWVDSRYWVQADAQLAETGIDLMKLQAGQVNPYIDWLAAHLPRSAAVGFDADLLALAPARVLIDTLKTAGIALRDDLDLFERAWLDRPGLPQNPVFEHLPPQACVSRTEKLAAVRSAMAAAGAAWHFVSTLDDIAWIFNLRGADVDYNPVFVAHALIGMSQVTLFVAAGKVSGDLAGRLAADGVSLAPYADARQALARLDGPCGAAGAGTSHMTGASASSVLIDPRRITLGLRQALSLDVKVIEAPNPSTLAKSRKTPAEAEQIRRTMEHDGAALCEFFAWLEAAIGQRPVSEIEIDTRLREARGRRPGFVTTSFGTIAGFNANGAMPHYRALPEAHAMIEGDGLLLIDSGGQYLGGTTDITRVVPIGQTHAGHRRDFTLVLKGMIALSRARFPLGIRSPMLDALARAPLWAESLDYGHGTGHGVGYFLNVHEGPQVISHYAAADPNTAMQPGMITSIEPGIYRPAAWGIRIENLVINQPAEPSEFGEYLRFETLTLCPIDTRLIDRQMLGESDRLWLNDYHATVRQRLGPLVEGAALAWLERRTEPL